jgi:hypothetical protein
MPIGHHTYLPKQRIDPIRQLASALATRAGFAASRRAGTGRAFQLESC